MEAPGSGESAVEEGAVLAAPFETLLGRTTRLVAGQSWESATLPRSGDFGDEGRSRPSHHRTIAPMNTVFH